MPRASIVRSTLIKRTPRVQQCEGMFDIPISEMSVETWDVSIPLEEINDWNIGLIVGPSGCGKSTIARELFGEHVFTGFEWKHDAAVIDDFPAGMGIKEITTLLSSVGFSSPPLWLRPFHVLSTGQQMRVNVARLLAEQRDVAVFDEYTSVVDRAVAQIGSAAIAKTVRTRGQRFVAVTCHYDVVDWLQPDWVYQPHVKEFLRRDRSKRPPVELEIVRVHRSGWELFKQYHYLSASMNKSARCFAAFYAGAPVAFLAVLPMPHPSAKGLYRAHRLVCLPDYQGVGIGMALAGHIASAYRGICHRFLVSTSSPSLNAGFRGRSCWRMTAAPRTTPPVKGINGWRAAFDRLVASWEYVGQPMDDRQARGLIYG